MEGMRGKCLWDEQGLCAWESSMNLQEGASMTCGCGSGITWGGIHSQEKEKRMCVSKKKGDCVPGEDV